MRFSRTDFRIIQFCGEECRRQDTDPTAVHDMLQAWQYMELFEDSLEGFVVEQLGILVDQEENPTGYRQVPIYFKNSANLPHDNHTTIRREVDNLVDAWNRDIITDEEFYQELMKVHPFLDGNGRVGAILWNWMKNTMSLPSPAPEFKDKTDSYEIGYKI